MPGATIEHYLASGSEAHFQEVAQVFRHDFVLYAGLLLSWATLFEGEVLALAEAPKAFTAATSDLVRATQQLHDNAQPHLNPALLDDQQDCDLKLALIWDAHYADFVAFARPLINRLEIQIRDYTARPEFRTIIQQSLGPAAGHEPIDQMLLNAHKKLITMLEPDRFDQRMAGVLAAQQ